MNRARWVIAARWTLITLFVVGTGLHIATGLGGDPGILLPIAVYTVVGALVTARRPENPIGWVFLGVAGVTGLGSVCEVTSSLAIGWESTPWWAVLAAGVGAMWFYPLLALMTTFTVLLYPSGLASPRWRPVLWLSIASIVALMVMDFLRPTLCLGTNAGDCSADRIVDNPWSPRFMTNVADVESTTLFTVVGFTVVLCMVAAGISAVIRTRRAVGVERLQMRWFSFAICVLIADLFVGSRIPWLSDGTVLGYIANIAALTMIPVSCGIAILRYRLYEIDRIVSRTTTYAVLTGALIAVYAVTVTSVSHLLPDPQNNQLAVAAATLLVAALFRPALRRIQDAVDHRFNRPRFDAERAVEGFAGRLREEIEPDQVAADLFGVLEQTLQPSSVTLWLPEASS